LHLILKTLPLKGAPRERKGANGGKVGQVRRILKREKGSPHGETDLKEFWESNQGANSEFQRRKKKRCNQLTS